MDRRDMLTMFGGLALGGLLPAAIGGQTSMDTQRYIPWSINEEELKTTIILPGGKKTNKYIKTNRLYDFGARDEKLIKMAEAVYPTEWVDSEMENGKPLWYAKGNQKLPYNVTSRAVNYYFDLATTGKASCTYNVEVSRVLGVKNEKTKKGNDIEIKVVRDPITIVTLNLNYGYVCGTLCCWGFDRRKMVIFNESGEIVSLYMPTFAEIMC